MSGVADGFACPHPPYSDFVKLWIAALAAIAACAAIWITASAQPASEWLVESDADAGAGTLRWAIEGADESSGDDVIRFASAMTIRPRSPLPELSDEGITIDASRGDASADITPRVWLDGSRAGDAAGLELIAAQGVVRGLGIYGFERYGIGVIGVEASRARIEGNWIGMRADGRASPNRLSGVAVIGGASEARVIDNRIGGNSVSGRTGHGIVIGGGGSVDAEVRDNLIGIGPDGSRLPNDDGILIVDSAQATIEDNTIGNSGVAGIELRQTRLEVSLDANRIGLRRDGALAPNDVGVFLGPGSANARVGSRRPNVVAGNRVGIAIEQGAREALIENNWVGLAPSDGSDRLQVRGLPQARVRPNQERGISVILGAAEIQLRNNYVAAGDFGIVVADSVTTRVSLTRNVVAGARQGPTEAAIDVRSGTEITIGGETGLGNHVCGAEFGIRLAETEEPFVDSNAIGASVATRVTFDSDDRLAWGIRFGDGVVRGKARSNLISDASRAGISVVGSASQDNSFVGGMSSRSSLGQNQFSGNGLDIDLGADGPTANDVRDRDRGPNGLLNHPVILDHTVRKVGDQSFGSTLTGTASPGSRVHIFERNGSRESRLTTTQPADRNGNWTISISVIPSGVLRSLATESAGATSEFSPSFIPSQRVRLQAGVQWFAWSGPEVSIEQAMAPVRRWVQTAWVYRSSDGGWRGWSPSIPDSQSPDRGGLRELLPGDVVRLQLSGRPPRDFFVPAGGEALSSYSIELVRGFNSATWLDASVDSLDALSRFDADQPGLIGRVWQWRGADESWELIWPRVATAWDPGLWDYPALWITATRDGKLSLP